MQRRLVFTYTSVIAVLLLALGIPLVLSFAMNDYHHLAIARINDTARFAVQAVPVLRRDAPASTLERTMREYDAATGASVVLVDRDGTVVAVSRPNLTLDDPQWRQRLAQASAGVRSDGSDYPYNVHAEPLFIAEPVESNNTVLGAVATISPTDELRTRATVRGALLGLAILGAVAAGVVVSLVLARWIMRPVRLLDRTAVAVAAGRYDVRAPQDTGPRELRRLARAFNTMADRLTSLLRSQRTFVADASHQLRNPLTALRLQVESLEPFVTEPGRPVLDATLGEVKRLDSILEALLRLAGAQARHVRPHRIEVSPIVVERTAAWRGVAEQRGVRLQTSGPTTAVCCPPDIVDQVLDVLLDNAVGVAPPGSVVRVETVERGDTVEVHVADQGPGMTAEDKARACDRFWRGQGASERDGTGLGLAIAATLLGTAGGSLAFHDVRPRGLDAVVRLPAARPRRGERGVPHDPHRDAAAVSTR